VSRRANGLRILIAEGEDIVRRGVRSLLQGRTDWKICGEAVSARETMEKTKVLQPDLLVLELAMPDMEAAKAIPKIIEVCPMVRVVALATQDSPVLAANALGAGATGVALKSEAASELLLTVDKVAKGQCYLSPAAVNLIKSYLAKRGAAPRPADLSSRELQVLECLARGQSNKVLAAALGISVKTVNAHRSNIMRKLTLHSYSDLIQFAIRHGII
jgi:DNA-binding NarL/FixJ family response regulator